MKNLDTVSHIVFQFHLLNHSDLSLEIPEIPPEDGEERIERLKREIRRKEYLTSNGKVSLKKIPEQILFSEFFLFGLVAQRRIDIAGEDLVLEFRFISNANLYKINRGRVTHFCYSDDGFPSLKFRDLTNDYLWDTSFYLDQTEKPLVIEEEVNIWFFVSRGPCVPSPVSINCLELAENMPFISSP